MEKEIKIVPPEGYEIDKENSTFECIKFKEKKIERWADSDPFVSGWWIDGDKGVRCNEWQWDFNHDVYATEKQAKSALAMAMISQIMANDKRFGGPVTDEEWKDRTLQKYTIVRDGTTVKACLGLSVYMFLAFHTEEQRELFLQENRDLVEDYLMFDGHTDKDVARVLSL